MAQNNAFICSSPSLVMDEIQDVKMPFTAQQRLDSPNFLHHSLGVKHTCTHPHVCSAKPLLDTPRNSQMGIHHCDMFIHCNPTIKACSNVWPRPALIFSVYEHLLFCFFLLIKLILMNHCHQICAVNHNFQPHATTREVIASCHLDTKPELTQPAQHFYTCHRAWLHRKSFIVSCSSPLLKNLRFWIVLSLFIQIFIFHRYFLHQLSWVDLLLLIWYILTTVAQLSEIYQFRLYARYITDWF